MSSLFFHKIHRLPTKEKEISVEERREQSVEYEIRVIRREIESFKTRGLSFIIDDFHRPDGKIVERTVSTDLETYTDKISEEEYETGNIEDLDYIDKFKVKFLFPVLARRKFDNIEPVEIDEIDNWKNPTIMPVTKEEEREAADVLLKSMEEQARRTTIIHLNDTNTNSKVEFYKNISYISAIYDISYHSTFQKETEELFDILIEKLINTDSSTKNYQ